MPDSPITSRDVTVEQLFRGATFALDYYQRPYDWGLVEVRTLLDDLTRRFLAQWKEDHEREQVEEYAPYFLGPYVYHDEKGKTFLVDGQQRITTLHLLLIYLYSLLNDQEQQVDAEGLIQLIHGSRHGRRIFSMDADGDPERGRLLDALMTDWNNADGYMPPDAASVSLRSLYERSREIDDLFDDELRGDALVFFVQWLLTRVCLVGIKAVDRDNAREIFVSMNDRGTRPTPADLLKSHLFGRLGKRASPQLNKQWADMIAHLSLLGGSNPVSGFLQAYLLAHHARFDGSDDAERITQAFHDWVGDHEQRIGVSQSGGAEEFIKSLARESEHYCALHVASGSYRHELDAVFYNRYNGIDGQYALMLSAIRSSDNATSVRQKCRLVARYVDLVYVLSVVNNLPARSKDINAAVHELIPALRQCARVEEVAELLGRQAGAIPEGFVELDTFGLRGNNRRTVRYLLARITAYVDVCCREPDQVDRFLNEDTPCEIEHIWANKFDRYKALSRIGTYANFDDWRNRLGALLLLPKSVNASYGDLPYDRKLEFYYSENRLAASLHPRSRERNAPFTKIFKNDKQLDGLFRPIPKEFLVKDIELRQSLYRILCERIWSPERLGFTVPKQKATQEQIVRRRTRAHYGVRPADLIAAGLLPPDVRIYRTHKGEHHWAKIEGDGTIRLDTGQPFPSLSAAGAAVARAKASPGWDVWRVVVDGEDVPLKEIRTKAITTGQLQMDLGT